MTRQESAPQPTGENDKNVEQKPETEPGNTWWESPSLGDIANGTGELYKPRVTPEPTYNFDSRDEDLGFGKKADKKQAE